MKYFETLKLSFYLILQIIIHILSLDRSQICSTFGSDFILSLMSDKLWQDQSSLFHVAYYLIIPFTQGPERIMIQYSH